MQNIQEITIPQECINDPAKVKNGANAGNAEYQYILGIMYLKGEGVFRDCDKAVYWIKEAAKNGHGQASSIADKVEELAAQVTATSTSSVSRSQSNANNSSSIVDSEGIHWNPEKPDKLNMEYYENLGTVYKTVGIGAIITVVLGCAMAIINYINVNVVAALITLFLTLPLGLIGIIGADGLEKRKPSSVFLCLSYAWICTFSNAIDIIVNVASGSFPAIYTLFWLVFGAAVIYMLYRSEDVKSVFPKDYQQTSPLVKGSVYTYSVIIVLLLLLGILIGSMSNN